MAITDWPLDDRPREKLISKGAEALSDAELVAVFVRTGVRGKSAVDLAREALARFGSLSGVCFAAGGARLPAVEAPGPAARGFRGSLPRCAEPRARRGGAFSRHAHPDQRLSARGGEARARPHRGG